MKTTLAADLAAMPRAHTNRRGRCLLGVAVDQNPAVATYADDLGYSATELSKTLAKHGIKVSASTIRNHRRGNECACAKA